MKCSVEGTVPRFLCLCSVVLLIENCLVALFSSEISRIPALGAALILTAAVASWASVPAGIVLVTVAAVRVVLYGKRYNPARALLVAIVVILLIVANFLLFAACIVI